MDLVWLKLLLCKYCVFFIFFGNLRFDQVCVCLCSKIVELEEELRVVGNNLKSLEVSEEKVCLLCFFIIIALQI
jgi:hypothetical protein